MTKQRQGHAISAEERAYVAGYVDGEGCISTRKGRFGYIVIFLEVASKVKEPLVFMQSLYSGAIHEKTQHLRHAKIWRWRVTSNEAAVLFKDILPYLKVKREQAELALKLNSRPKYGGLSHPVPPEERKQREIIAQKIKLLNRKGPRQEQLGLYLKEGPSQLSLPEVL